MQIASVIGASNLVFDLHLFEYPVVSGQDAGGPYQSALIGLWTFLRVIQLAVLGQKSDGWSPPWWHFLLQKLHQSNSSKKLIWSAMTH
jgi:hypothetical protein